MKPSKVLAKTLPNGVWRARYGLAGHAANVVQCASILSKVLCLDKNKTLLLKEAAYFHDFGKANAY
ncbi:HD domain-containing protein, partial [Cylindrospermopsis raciborskii]|uniref:HD domain-containing protein n=1 Tax=Cylindrospermopsis raciborskii TaxID=77022 RepID=UPI0022CAF572